jgi:hypothetical protein
VFDISNEQQQHKPSSEFLPFHTGNFTNVFAMGARVISADGPDVMTSAHAEYEGLLLGLEWLSSQQPSLSSSFETLTIRGDCKSVLDQLHNPFTKEMPRSHPRVLQTQYRRAMTYLTLVLSSSTTTTTTIFEPAQLREVPALKRLVVEHVPRTSNTLCHNLCETVMEFVEEEAYNNLLQEVLECLSSIPSVKDGDRSLARAFSTPSPSSPSLLQVLQKYHLLGPTLSDCRTRYSIRPPLYRYLAQVARALDDYHALDAIGQALELEAKTVWSLARPSLPLSSLNSDNELQLLEQGLQYQMDAIISVRMKGQGHNKQQERRMHALRHKQQQCAQKQQRTRNALIGSEETKSHGHHHEDATKELIASTIPKWFPPSRLQHAESTSTRPSISITNWAINPDDGNWKDAGVDNHSFNEKNVLSRWKTFLQSLDSDAGKVLLESKGIWLPWKDAK